MLFGAQRGGHYADILVDGINGGSSCLTDVEVLLGLPGSLLFAQARTEASGYFTQETETTTLFGQVDIKSQ